MALSTAYDFLTRAFAPHQTSELQNRLRNAGSTVSKREGSALGLDADTFARYYADFRPRGRSVDTRELLAHASGIFQSQAAALRASLEAGPGVDGFRLDAEVIDNWQAFLQKQNLFRYAELPNAHKAAVLTDARWDLDRLPDLPEAGAIARKQIRQKGRLPEHVRDYIADVESKHYVARDPAEEPPTADDIFQIRFRQASEVRIDDVLVGHVVHFDQGQSVALHVDGAEVTGGVKLFEIDPRNAVDFADLTPRQKIDALYEAGLPTDDSRNWSDLPVSDVLAALNSRADAATVEREVNGALDIVADTLDNDIYYAANISLRRLGITIDREFLSRFDSYQALVDHIVERTRQVHGDAEAEGVADALGNGGADVRQPEVEVYQENGQPIGATFTWSVSVDGDHDYWTKLFYDHTSHAFIGGATGGYETDTEIWVNE
jgi:hypothetical protein